MGNIKSQKPLEPAGNEPPAFGVSGWIAGWTLTARPDVLFRETAIPLGLVCARQPGQFDLEIPGVKEPWTLPIDANAECRISPHGIRMIEEHDDRDIMVSVFKHDASTLLVEADEATLLHSLDPEAVITDFEASRSINAGKHTMVFFLQRNTTPARMIITAGTGETQWLLSKARSLISLSAHTELDQILTGQAVPAAKSSYAISPIDYLLSRLRPASPTLSYPWLANDEDEPAWRMESIYPAFRALLLTHPELAAGLIGNLLEGMDGEGNVPLAGGHASPIFSGRPRCPRLMTMLLDYFQQTRAWPIETATHARRLEGYIKAISRAEPDDDEEHALAVVRELIQWNEFVRQSGMPESGSYPTPVGPAQRGAEQALPLSVLLDRRTPISTRKAMAVSLLENIKHNPEALLSVENLAVVPDVLTDLSEINRPVLSEWVSTLRTILAASWQNAMVNLISPAPSHRVDLLVLAGVCHCLEHGKSHNPEQHHQVAGWFDRHRIALLASSGVLIVLLAGFLFSVQFRSTIPLTVYETQMGMALQNYQTGNYPAAIETLEDIARRGHRNNPVNVFLLGKILYRNKKYPEAIIAFENVVKARPDSPAGYFNLGLSLFHQGDIEAAKKVFTEMSELFALTYPSSAARAVRAAEIVSRYEKTGDEAGFR